MHLINNKLGNKAKNLLKLKEYYNVPKFFCISSDEVKSILKEMGINEKEITGSFKDSPKKRHLIRNKIINSKVNIAIDDLKKLNEKIIIRSSAIGEDGKRFSFAGIYESKISKSSKEQFGKDLKYMLSSAFSERVWHYCKYIGFKGFPKISLVVQNYINPEYSGVTFTETPYNNKKGMLINAVKGSGEKAVHGKGVSEVFIHNNKIPKSNIPYKVLYKAVKECKKIQELFKEPQDIEWCYLDNKLYILQSRAITKNVHEEIKVWDNSNIAESYSGIVLPLTCSFAKFIYAQVYKDLARTSNIDPKKIEKYSGVFDNLLGFFYGRFYYNILNWYKMLTLFPGYERNKRNLDMMISARNRAKLNRDYHQNVHFIDKARYYPYIILRILRFENGLKKFKNHVKNYLKHTKDNNFEQANLKDLWKWFEDFQKNLLQRWSITVDNDFLAMTWFGYFKKYAQRYGLTEMQILSQITQIRSVISAQQVDALAKLAEKFHKNNKLLNLAEKSKWAICYKEMMRDSKMRGMVRGYLCLYGGRFANELKLEAKDLESDPAYLPQLLHSYKKKKISLKPNAGKINLQFHKRLLLNFLSSKAKHYLRHREELRLLRSQAFSYTRKLFISIGERLEKRKIINNYNDIFYLNLREIESIIKNKRLGVKNLIDQRKKDYSKYRKIQLDNVLVTKWDELPNPKDFKNIKGSSKLKGIGCSLGCISGKVTLLNEFKLPKKPLEIVVVKHTDPGWTPLFGICKGLIVENGGLLSHAAIISRELNLPCIIGVEHATILLKDGQYVTMDGSKGTISIG